MNATVTGTLVVTPDDPENVAALFERLTATLTPGMVATIDGAAVVLELSMIVPVES